jgi:hypothetical protein
MPQDNRFPLLAQRLSVFVHFFFHLRVAIGRDLK